MLSRHRFASLLALALAAVMLASCADESPIPSAPAAPDALLVDGLTQVVGETVNDVGSTLGRTVSGLVECNVQNTLTASRVIGPSGGVLKVGRHQLYVPPQALSENVLITATAPAGQHVEVRFEPHGLEFNRPTVLTVSYAECGLLKPLALRIVHVDDNLNILEVLPSLPNLFNRTVNGKLDHFSRYMLAD